MAGSMGGSWLNPFDNIAAQIGNTLGTSATAASGTYDNSSYTPSYQQQPQTTTNNQDLFIEDSLPLGTVSSSESSNTVNGGGTSAPAYDANELRLLDEQRSLYERLLQSADSTLGSGLQSINDSYDLNKARTDADKAKAMGRYTDQFGENDKSREKSLNTVGDNSRVLRNSLMRKLGLASGGGSAFDLADGAVAKEATKNRSNVLETFANNAKGIGRAKDDAEDQFARLLVDLNNAKRDRTQALETGVTGERQRIVELLGRIDADRARLTGGDQFAAADPYRQQYLGYQDKIDALPGQYRNKVDYQTADLQNPTLKDYMVNRASIGGSAPGAQQRFSPYSNFLQQDRDEEEQRLA